MLWLDFLSACKAVLDQHGSGWIDTGRPLGTFLLGLVGGATHCSGMCGPFVLGQVGARLGQTPVTGTPVLTRLRGMALLPYHAGRTVTYSVLGATAAGLAGGVGRLAGNGALPAFAIGAGALLMAVMAWRQLVPAGEVLSRTGSAGQWVAARFSRLFARPGGASGFGLGLALGFLPCGLVYTALLLAGASGDWITGAAMMAAFALGTMPALIGVGFLGAMAARRWRERLRWWTAPVLLLNAVMLALLALRWLAL